ncbi:MAG: permease [Isosphaeraceae bacterium]
MSIVAEGPTKPARLAWFARGDFNAFFGLMLDNIGGMILMVGLLASFGFPADFVVGKMIPGTALGVLVGDLIFTGLALRLMMRAGRGTVTAMPLGLDTPSTFGSVILILGPAFLEARGRGLEPEAAAIEAWYIGIAMLLASGAFKLACALASGWIRRMVPRAGLLGSLAAIALVIISFLPLREIVAHPVAGLSALAVILATLTARWELPGRIPGALAGVVVGCLVYYAMTLTGLDPAAESAGIATRLGVALPMPMQGWWAWFQSSGGLALKYLPIAIPLALATVVGGIDCTESAAAAGDDYATGLIIATEGLATLVAGCFGGVIQTTPYIGQPAYKAMGARAGYTLATALFIGGAGIFGYFSVIFQVIPQSVVFPILIFVGLEITSQSFHATPYRHFPAIGLACVPALGYLGIILIGQVLADAGKPFGEFGLPSRQLIQTLTMLSGGFILTSLLWATALAKLIDGRAQAAASTFVVAAILALFGVIHSPLPSSPILAPWQTIAKLRDDPGRFEASARQTPYHWAGAYLAAGAIASALGRWGRPPLPETSEVGRAA